MPGSVPAFGTAIRYLVCGPVGRAFLRRGDGAAGVGPSGVRGGQLPLVDLPPLDAAAHSGGGEPARRRPWSGGAGCRPAFGRGESACRDAFRPHRRGRSDVGGTERTEG